MAFSQDILKKLEYKECENYVRFVYDGWLGFHIYVNKNLKLQAGRPYDKNNQKSLNYIPSYGPIYNAAYKLAWKMLVAPKKQGDQMTLDLDVK